MVLFVLVQSIFIRTVSSLVPVVLGFWNFFVFSNFFRSNSFIFESKVEKIYMGVFSTHFVTLILILATKVLEEQNRQLYKCWFLQTAEDHK